MNQEENVRIESNPFSASPGKRIIDAIKEMNVEQMSVFLCQQGWSPLEVEDCKRWLLSDASDRI